MTISVVSGKPFMSATYSSRSGAATIQHKVQQTSTQALELPPWASETSREYVNNATELPHSQHSGGK